MGQGANKESLTPVAQLGRWKSFVSQWEKALDEKKETIVLGDVNIDWLCCCSEDQPACLRQAAKWSAAKPLLEEFNRRIMPHSMIQSVRGTTRSARSQADSALDLIFISVPKKLSEPRALIRAYLDHRLVLATRFTKNIVTSPRYVKKRSFKNFDQDKFIEEVRNTSRRAAGQEAEHDPGRDGPGEEDPAAAQLRPLALGGVQGRDGGQGHRPQEGR